MSILRDFVVCPYNKNHVIRNHNVQNHLPNCKEKHQNACLVTCRFNSQRLCEEDLEFLGQAAPENTSSKSKRRRDRIRERQILKPRVNDPARKSGSNGKAVKMNNKQELWDAGEDWDEPERSDSSNEKSVLASNDNAEPSLEAADQRSKKAKKRLQKKQRKGKGTGDNVPADKPEEKKEYVIKLNESVSVTETNRACKEVFIHYPTRQLLSPDGVPKDGLGGIQPMMLQRICFEAFMKMQHSSDGERNRVSSSANENKSKTNQFSDETANGCTSSVNEDENKTTLANSGTASGVTPSEIMKEIKTTQASDGKLNADLYCPKRYKPKKDKKKGNANPKATGLHSGANSSSFEVSSLRDRFAKYMISEDDELPPPRPHTNKYAFPVPYMECEDDEVSGESEVCENIPKHANYDIQQYLCDDEWPDEKDYESTDENENADAINQLKDEEADKTENSPKDGNNSGCNPYSPEEEKNGKRE